MARKAKETPHLRLRVEAALLSRLQKSAEKNDRTLTGEIVHRLEGSFHKDDFTAQIQQMADRIAAAAIKLQADSAAAAAAHATKIQGGDEQ